MELFFYLLIVWAAVTVLGHGTWVLVSRLFGSQRSLPRDGRQLSRPACPRCGALLGSPTDRCAVCSWPREEGVRTDPQAALRSLRLQLAELSRLNALDAETHAALQEAVRAQQQRLAELEPAATTAPAQSAAPLPASEATPSEPSAAAAHAMPRTPAPLDERARAYAASRAAAADEDSPPPVAPTQPPQREAMSRLFAAFIEEKNIRWGELVGGLLIVGSSVALVISFWSEIAARPLLKFVLFNGVTAALFGVGLYTDRRWKIHTTSHGLLVIATLLVPLNFLAIAAFTQASPPTDAVSIAGEAASLVVFSLLVFLAGKIVAPGAAALLTVGVMVPSLMQLLVRRWAGPASSLAELYALAGVPIACYVACNAVAIRRRWLEPALDAPAAHRLFTLLGVLSAATLLPLALVAFRVPPPAEIIHRLSPLVVWYGVPGLLVGLLFWRRLTDRNLSGQQTAGLAVGVLGAGIMAGAVVAAWPEPATLLPVAVMIVVAFAAVAFWFAIPAAHLPAGLALALAWLIAFHLYRGNVEWTLASYEPMGRALVSAASGHALVPLAALFGVIAWLLGRAGRRDDAAIYAAVAATTAAVSLALVMWFGFAQPGDPEGATWILALYAIAALVAAGATNRTDVAWVGMVLALLALVQAVVFRYAAAWQLERPWIVALLAHAALAVIADASVGVRRFQRANPHAAFRPCVLISTAAAAALLVVFAQVTSVGTLVALVLVLAGVWVALATLAGWPRLFTAAQVAVLCAAFAVAQLISVQANALPTWLSQLDGPAGWSVFALVVAAAWWLTGHHSIRQSVVSLVVATLVAMLTLTALRWDTGNWLAYRTLLAGSTAAACVLPLVTLAAHRIRAAAGDPAEPIVWSAISVRTFAVAAVALALFALDGDPAAPWWTIAVLAVISARNVWIAWSESRRGFMWIAALLAHLAVSIWWIDTGHRWTGTQDMAQGLEFLWTNALAAAAMAIVSFAIDRRRPEPREGESVRGSRVSFHRFAAWAIASTLLFTTGIGLLADLFGEQFRAYMPLAWAAWLAAMVTAIECWWDPRSRWPVACIYTVGLVGVGTFLDGLNFQPPMFHWALALSLAAYSLSTSYLWSRRSEIGQVLVKLRVPNASADIASGGGQHWLIAANGLSAAAVVALVAWIVITLPDFTRRMFAAYAVAAEAIALGLLARGAVRSSLQYAALVFGALFAVAFGWALLSPDIAAPWLHRAVAAAAALAVMIVLYGLGLVKLLRRENEWTRAVQRLVPLLVVIATGLVLVVLAIEVTAYVNDGSVPITWTALVTLIVALVGMAVAALVAALVPGRDPLGLSERGRTAYVYAAEALAALTFLHIRVTMPWLFTGWFLRFWPLVVMAIAFVGVGLGEFFQRRRQQILSEPLQNTGALLPLLPALGFWVTASEVHYSLLLLSVGVLYSAMSVLRKSFAFAVLAAIAANGSLWYLLHTRAGLGLLEHPQLWLIPPAFCVLVAGYLNRERLTAEQSAALRYGSAMVIYVSSTADIFINGVADAPWLPAVLAGLSILGVFAGMLLRVRAFLYLGTAFLVVALMTIIWYAAFEQQRTWILWIAGIVTGVAIIALFGLFEKRRDDVLRLVERLKQWEA